MPDELLGIVEKIEGVLREISSGREVQEIGKTLKRFRSALRLSPDELAASAGVTGKTVRNVEDAITKKLSTITDLLRALHHIAIAPTLPTNDQVTVKWLSLPRDTWARASHGPASILRADFEVVPFHGRRREAERDELLEWCQGKASIGIRVYRAEGGMGKTRLALEVCRKLLRHDTSWHVGFLDVDRFEPSEFPWSPFAGSHRPKAFIVVDYAGDTPRTKAIANLLRTLESTCPLKIVRLLLLDRNDLWLGRLYADRGTREILEGESLSFGSPTIELKPALSSDAERKASWTLAAKSFADQLGVSPPNERPKTFTSTAFDQVLLLHMSALLSALGGGKKTGEKAILNELLRRERAYWVKIAQALHLPLHVTLAVEEALYLVFMNGGVKDTDSLLQLLREAPLLAEEPALVRQHIARLLRECYPRGERGIAPLEPDLLGELLVEEHLRNKNP